MLNNNVMETKLVILIRKDLNLNPGQIAAQASHAAMLFLIKHLITNEEFLPSQVEWLFGDKLRDKKFVYGGIKKIVLWVDNITEMANCVSKADANSIEVNVYDDETLGITACAIGPDFSVLIDQITGHLKLVD